MHLRSWLAYGAWRLPSAFAQRLVASVLCPRKSLQSSRSLSGSQCCVCGPAGRSILFWRHGSHLCHQPVHTVPAGGLRPDPLSWHQLGGRLCGRCWSHRAVRPERPQTLLQTALGQALSGQCVGALATPVTTRQTLLCSAGASDN